MDDPAIDPEALRIALRDLDRINRMSLSAASIVRAIRRVVSDLSHRDRLKGPLRVLDVGCGGGGTTRAVAARLARSGIVAEVSGCDMSAEAISAATRMAASCAGKHRRPDFFTLEVGRDAIPSDYDVIISSLFLHHLPTPLVRDFLREAADACARGLVINDLRRSAAAYRFTRWGTRVVSRSPVVHHDGPVSVEAAFTLDEARDFAREVGLAGAVIRKSFPFRLQITWRRGMG